MTYYPGIHKTQFDGGPLAKQNCGPTSLAMLAHQATAGHVDWTGSEVRALIPRDEETNPATPGWSMVDVDRAASKLGVYFWNGYGRTWDDAAQVHREGRGIVFQGDSDQFVSGCSAAFDGDHSTYLPAADPDHLGRWKIGDPICTDWTWQSPETIRAYAEKFGRAVFGTTSPQKISFGYGTAIPLVEEDMDATRFAPVALCDVRAGGTLYADPDRTTIIGSSWPGGTGIQLYALPVVPVQPDGKSALAPIRYDKLGGPPQELVVAYIGADLVGNIRLVDAPPVETVTITGQNIEITGP